MISDTAQITRTSSKNADREQAIGYLKETYLKTGDTVYAILRHVSTSGMSRMIDLYVMKNNRPLRITWTVARALDMRYNRKHEALHIGGCGFDVAHDTVSNLAWRIFGNADALSYQWI